jgi:major intracellular serine protease
MNYDNPYYIEKLRIKEIHEKGYKGEGITIAIIDSGADYNHKELKNAIHHGINFTCELDGNKFDYMDLFYHGTAVLSIIKKIAPNAKIIVIKSMQNGGKGTVNDVLNGLNYALSQKVDIISMSVGTRHHNSNLEKKIKQIVGSGISVVVSAGNENDGKSNTKEVAYPAYYQEVISVGSCNKNEMPSYFSNTNDLIDLITYGEKIQIIKPKNQYGVDNGTSFSCPIVAGVLALIKQYMLTQGEVTEKDLFEELIKNTKLIEGKDKSTQGHGILTLDNFIEKIGK